MPAPTPAHPPAAPPTPPAPATVKIGVPGKWRVGLAAVLYGALVLGCGFIYGWSTPGMLPALLVLVGILATLVADELDNVWFRRIRAWAFGLAIAWALLKGVLVIGGPILEAQLAADPLLAAQVDKVVSSRAWQWLAGGSESEVALKNAIESVNAATDEAMAKAATDPSDPLHKEVVTNRVEANLVTIGITEGKAQPRFTVWDGLECEWKMGIVHKIAVTMKLALMTIVGVGLLWFLFVVATTWNDPKSSIFHKLWVGAGKWGLMATAGLIVGTWIVTESPTQDQCRLPVADEDSVHEDVAAVETPAPKTKHSQKKSAVAEACEANRKDFAAQGLDFDLLPKACR